MDDLVSRSTACDEIGKMIHEYRENGDHDLADALILVRRYVLKQLPAVDAAPIVKGRWERVGSDSIVCCSVCGVPMNKTRVCWPDGGSGYYYIATKYCPHCGARNEKGDCDG